MVSSIEIPNKSLFKVNEVCSLTNVKSYVLRFWESEFDEITPVVSESGQKLYRRQDLEAVFCIRKLLFDDKLTIEKARLEIKSIYHPEEDEQVNEISQDDGPRHVKVTGSLSDSDIQKLVLAKAKLSSLVGLAETIKKGHDWS